jgi:guanylate kinase
VVPGGRGKLFVVTAPSGAGKTTLIKWLLAEDASIAFSVSYTTRAPREGEQDGRDYFFVSRAEFERMIAGDKLLEYARVFDNFYGTGREPVERELGAGRNVLLDIDWQGAAQVRSRMRDGVYVFIMPPSFEELARRLRSRGTDSSEVIARRLSEARADMARWNDFDYVIVNDDLPTAQTALRSVISGANTANRTGNPALAARIGAILGAAPRGPVAPGCGLG